ncbi:putative signaling protein [bacterium HR40]|nr:putative signaling protein [bacterium HR40]
MIPKPRNWPLVVRALVLMLAAQVAGLALLFANGERLADRAAESAFARLRDEVLPSLARAIAAAALDQDRDEIGRLLAPWVEADGVLAIQLRTASGQLLYEVRNPQRAAETSSTLALPVTLGAEELGTLAVMVDLEAFRSLTRSAASSSMLLVACGLSAGTLFLALLAVRLAGRVEGLARAATAIAEGATGARAPVAGPPELRALAGAFNAMVDRLLEANHRLAEERERLANSERRFREFAQAASDWLWETDADHRFVYFSQLDNPEHPFDQPRLLGKRRQDVIAECDPELLRQHLEDLAQRRPFRDFRYAIRDRHGTLRTIEVSGRPQFDTCGRFTGYRGVARDVTEKMEAERRIHYLATHDTLTRLANRPAFDEQLRRALAVARRNGSKVGLLLFDLDGFRRVNELYGHAAGDLLLRHTAERLVGAIREGDLAARLAADEFVVLQPDVTNPGECAALASRLVRELGEPFGEGRCPFRPSVSCGIVLFPDNGEDAEALLRHASVAVARAKHDGGGGFRFFEADMEKVEARRRLVEAELRRVLQQADGAGLALHIQPRVTLDKGELCGGEALLRWRHPELGELPPSLFVAIAEQAGLAHELGSWVLREACRLLASWHRELPAGFRLAVNLSPLQFRRHDIVREVASALAENRVPGGLLELEITESALVEDTDATVRQLARFRELGIALALDDFGTGYSSLGYLKRFALDKLKIDRSFVSGLADSKENGAIVRAIITLARSLELGVVAEGVESEPQRQFLLREGCREAQGHLFAAALPAEIFARDWLALREKDAAPPSRLSPAQWHLSFSAASD